MKNVLTNCLESLNLSPKALTKQTLEHMLASLEKETEKSSARHEKRKKDIDEMEREKLDKLQKEMDARRKEIETLIQKKREALNAAKQQEQEELVKSIVTPAWVSKQFALSISAPKKSEAKA